jgi:hypothetical protein
MQTMDSCGSLACGADRGTRLANAETLMLMLKSTAEMPTLMFGSTLKPLIMTEVGAREVALVLVETQPLSPSMAWLPL